MAASTSRFKVSNEIDSSYNCDGAPSANRFHQFHFGPPLLV